MQKSKVSFWYYNWCQMPGLQFLSPLYEEGSLMMLLRIMGHMRLQWWGITKDLPRSPLAKVMSGMQEVTGWEEQPAVLSTAVTSKQEEKKFLWSVRFCPIFVFVGYLLCLLKKWCFPSQVTQPWHKWCDGGMALTPHLCSDSLCK